MFSELDEAALLSVCLLQAHVPPVEAAGHRQGGEILDRDPNPSDERH